MTAKNRKKRFPKYAACVTAALLLAAATVLPVGATAISRDPPSVTVKDTATYAPVEVFWEEETVHAYLVNGTTMVPLRAFYDTLFPGCEIAFDEKTRTATVEGRGFSLQITDRARVLYANRRVLYADTPGVILDDGRIYVPVRLLAKTLGLSVEWNGEHRTVSLSGVPTPLEDGLTYYREDELYWLSRIISAESRGEPLLGQVAVGNVVLNRVKSPEFPNTIYGVIFDRKHGVQFTPIANGEIWREPYSVSVVAAKLCLEGYTVSDTALYFLDLKIATSLWVPQNRPYAFKIGNHTFYR